MKCEKCGAELDENNICPICDNKPEGEEITANSEREVADNETKIDIEALENLKVDSEEVEGVSGLSEAPHPIKREHVNISAISSVSSFFFMSFLLCKIYIYFAVS